MLSCNTEPEVSEVELFRGYVNETEYYYFVVGWPAQQGRCKWIMHDPNTRRAC